MPNVKVVNTTGIAKDTQVFIDGVEVPKSSVAAIDIRMRPDEFVTATLELLVNDVDVVGDLKTAASDEVPDRDQWIINKLEKEYAQYWNEEQQLYVIIEPGKDNGDGTASGDEIWKPTRDELVADLEKSYEFEFGKE